MKPNSWKTVFIIILVVTLFNINPAMSYVPDNLDFVPMGDGAVSGAHSGRTYTVPSINYKMVYIPAGSFMMGSPSNEPKRDSDERQHKVTLTKGFYMGVTEVTVGQWRLFIQDTGYRTEAETGDGAYIYTGKEWKKKKGYYWDNPGFSQTKKHPVTCVSWNDAQKFIKWLNKQNSGNKYRLPTEAEWEYACRAGSKTRFCFGDSDSRLGDYAWYGSNASGETHSVAQKKPNAWGLYDMHGNVWELCRDWYEKNYPSAYVTDPEGSSSGTVRVLRGGAWDGSAGSLRSADRNRSASDYRRFVNGFRVVSSG